MVYNINVLNGLIAPLCLGMPSLKALYIEKIQRKVLKMKLAKKMLACAMALAMVAALALTAFAAAPVVTMSATEYAEVGEEVTITVAATGMAGLMSADLEFTYDAAALEFKSIAKAADSAYDMGAGDKVADGTVTWSFMYMNSAEADSGLAVLTFKVLKAGNTDVALKINSWDGTDAPADVTVTVSQMEIPSEIVPPVDDDKETTTKKEPGTGDKIHDTGDAGVAAIAGVMAIAAVAFVATRKKDEE